MYSTQNVARNVDFCSTEIVFVIKYQMSGMTYRQCTSSFMQIDAKMRAAHAFFRFFNFDANFCALRARHSFLS